MKKGPGSRSHRNDAGFNIIEILIAIGLMIFIALLVTGMMMKKHGFHLWTLAYLATPLALMAVLFLLSLAGEATNRGYAAWAVERVLRFLERADPDRAERAHDRIRRSYRLERYFRMAIEARRERVVAALNGPWPGREFAYRLHRNMGENDRGLVDISGPLIDALSRWPSDVFGSVLYDLGHRGVSSEAVGLLLARPSTSRGLRSPLSAFFNSTRPLVPTVPTPEWVAVLRPYRAELETLLLPKPSNDCSAPLIQRYLDQMA